MKAVLLAAFVASIFAALPTNALKNDYGQKLSDYVKHYDSLNYDVNTIDAQHTRLRRSTELDESLKLDFQAHDRLFQLRLKRELSTFSSDFVAVNSHGKPIEVDTSNIYRGVLKDDPDSEVFGSVIDGVFEGKIITQDGTYYVENARHYFPNKITHHSIIYEETDLTDLFDELDYESYKATDKEPQSVEKVQDSEEEEEEEFNEPRYIHSNKHSKGGLLNSRKRRAITDKNTCSLYIRTDPTLWRHIKEGIPDSRNPSKQGEVYAKIKSEIISLISHHVMALNYIFSYTKFDGRYEHRNINFVVHKIKMDTDFSCLPRNYDSEENKYCSDDLSMVELLDLFSRENHDDYCLAYLFTFRNFLKNVIGGTYLAEPHVGSGGICEKYIEYTKKNGSIDVSTKHSLNIGSITLMYNNKPIPTSYSQLNFAREIGYNFGSPRDYPAECKPGGKEGNFLMYKGKPEYKPNNSRFSPCSIANISKVLDALHDGRKRNCLIASERSYCGNKIVEPGEECDCGYDEAECTDRCCYPRILGEFNKERNSTAKPCARRANTQCSPSQGTCCNSATCQIVPAQTNFICRAATDCSRASYCMGDSVACPVSEALPDQTLCNHGTQNCVSGECSVSRCLSWGMKGCFLSSADVTDRRTLCQLACETENGDCQSTSEFAHRVGLPAGGITFSPGTPCDDNQGYCDSFSYCQEKFIFLGGN